MVSVDSDFFKYGWCFDGSGISKECFIWIINNIKIGSTIIELGSGDVSTKYLSTIYNLISIEENIEYCGKYPANYINAKLEKGWYSIDIIKKNIPKNAELILVDGPTGSNNRWGILNNVSLFPKNAIWLMHDTHRPEDKNIAIVLSNMLRKELFIYEPDFGIIK